MYSDSRERSNIIWLRGKICRQLKLVAVDCSATCAWWIEPSIFAYFKAIKSLITDVFLNDGKCDKKWIVTLNNESTYTAVFRCCIEIIYKIQ